MYLSPIAYYIILSFFVCQVKNNDLSHHIISFTSCVYRGLSQATGGTDLVKKCLSSLLSSTQIQRVAMVDAHGYDTAPALATLEALVI